jgi:uncharacterized membrane protein YedE/YeeE
MAQILAGLAAGLVFGLGLAVSGMADPLVVLGFLDLAGSWDPTLLFVMGGAVPVTFVGYRLVLGRGRPLLAERLTLPTLTRLDAPLLGGAALFGIGWGIAGYCPGPALASLSAGAPGTLLFVAMMLAGMIAVRLVRTGASRPSAQPQPNR